MQLTSFIPQLAPLPLPAYALNFDLTNSSTSSPFLWLNFAPTQQSSSDLAPSVPSAPTVAVHSHLAASFASLLAFAAANSLIQRARLLASTLVIPRSL